MGDAGVRSRSRSPDEPDEPADDDADEEVAETVESGVSASVLEPLSFSCEGTHHVEGVSECKLTDADLAGVVVGVCDCGIADLRIGIGGSELIRARTCCSVREPM